jgi:hypothetical protein
LLSLSRFHCFLFLGALVSALIPSDFGRCGNQIQSIEPNDLLSSDSTSEFIIH